MIIGRAPRVFGSCMESIDASAGEPATEGPMGDDVLDLCSAGVDFEDLSARSARAAARSG